jgi:hypothetical protein
MLTANFFPLFFVNNSSDIVIEITSYGTINNFSAGRRPAQGFYQESRDRRCCHRSNLGSQNTGLWAKPGALGERCRR